MSTIYTREHVRECVARAMLQAPERGQEVAVEAAAHELALPVEAVRDAVAPCDEEATC